jgi:hypothetical protein
MGPRARQRPDDRRPENTGAAGNECYAIPKIHGASESITTATLRARS